MILGCSEPIELDEFDFDRVLIVDAVLTDELIQHQVVLAYSFPLTGDEEERVSNALVKIEDGAENCFDFDEISPGIYQSQVAFRATTGETYALSITTDEGNEYISTASNLIESPAIDTVYQRLLAIAPSTSDETGPGLQFFLDSESSETANFFRFEWEETYKIETPLSSDFIYDPQLDSIIPRPEPIHICYAGNRSQGIEINSSVGSQENRLVEVPIRFIPSESIELQRRYSILVRQYAISEEAHSFYRAFNEIAEGGGSLFDSQTGLIIGNISSVSDPTEVVLGFFELAGVSEKRVFFDVEEFDPSVRVDIPNECLTSNWIEPAEDELDFYLIRFRNQYEVIEEDPVKVVPRDCANCLELGITSKPTFWID